MTPVDLIIHNAGHLVTCASGGKPKRLNEMQDVGIIADGAVAIEECRIVGVGTSDEVLREFESEQTIDAEGRVVSPGFVDPHTHIVFAGDRLSEFELKIKGAEYLEILANGGGIISTVRHTREAPLSDLARQASRRLDKMLAHGTTTCEIKTGYGLDTETEIKMLRVISLLDESHPMDIVATFLAAHAIPPEFKDNSDGYTDLICDEMLPLAWEWFGTLRGIRRGCCISRRFFADVFCEKNAFSLEQTERVLKTAKSLGFELKAHVDEFTNLGGSRLGIEYGAVSIDHLDAISDAEVTLLAASDTVGIITPPVNFNFGSAEFADARKLMDSGCAIALSTDYNPGSAPCPSQPMVMAIACRYQKLLPAEAFNAVTINAAFALGLGDETGSIEAGKQADILILDTKDYREVAYEFGGNFVDKVIKKGKIIV
jgi:imidazolonepropionase